MVVTRLLEETNHLAVLARDVAEYYAACGLISIVPAALSCNMDSFGIITRKDWLLSPAARLVCEALEAAVAGSNKPRRDRPNTTAAVHPPHSSGPLRASLPLHSDIDTA